ncbi:hypothetical protein CYMTET_37648 [Cymbomonas tetramitiformis]|uniref:Ankyrin repeat protein n=1 Tax=Cymbomonas tetramitiformis TaxID=36881 RepID=A0AAE0CDG2_9CHLO|nr:hypothetical protein CYMTET_37648 [Cymbomonas tetramitiformis]
MLRYAMTFTHARVPYQLLILTASLDRVDILKLTLPAGRPNALTQQRMCGLTAKHNGVKCLSYLRENGYAWDTSTAVGAARFGSHECLDYALTHGCPRDEEAITRTATQAEHLDCLKCALKHGCQLSEQIREQLRMFQVDEDNPCDVYLRTLF